MLLAGKNGDRLELRVTNYEFPELRDDGSDANWLTIQLSVDIARGSWTATDPSLLTTEVAQLADWLDAIAGGQASESELEFLEPNLSFELLDATTEHVRLRAWFELELRPTWATSNVAEERDLCADLDVARRDLRTAAEALRAQLSRFPPRA
jgi:hypothetical protein